MIRTKGDYSMPIPDDEWVGGLLLKAIEESRTEMNYAQLAKKAGLRNKSTMYNIVYSGTGNTTLATAQAIFDALGYDLKVVKRK